MNRYAQAIQWNRILPWLVPLAAIAVFILSRPATAPINVREVSVSEAKALIDAGAVIVDVRGPAAFGDRRIPGALSIPLAELQAGIPASLAHAKDKPIVVYCNDGVTTGPKGTRLLNDAGYGGAVNLKSGIEGWQNASYPVRNQ